MKKSKIYEVLCGLSADTNRELQKWIATQKYALRNDVQALFEYLQTHKNDAVLLEKETAFVAIYGEKPYNDDTMRLAQSLLMKAVEQFLLQKNENASRELLELAQIYHELKLEKPFQQTFRRLTELQADTQRATAETLQLAADSEKLWALHQAEVSRMEETNLQTLLDAEEKAFAAAKLRTVCTALSYQNLSKRDYDFGLLNNLLAQIADKKWAETEPAIGAYFYIYKMNTETLGNPFFELFREKLVSYKTKFEPQEYKNIYLGAINYSIKQVNKGDQIFFKTVFELYKEGLKMDILLGENGELSHYTYKNIAAIGLRVGEAAYIFDFIERYKSAVPLKHRRNYYEYNLARYYFTTKDFRRALPLLKKLTYGDIFLQLDTKVMLLKMYYEQDKYDQLDAFLNRFQQLLLRKKGILSYHQQNYLNIIHCVKQIITRNPHDKTETANLREEIGSLQPLTEREWLLSVVNS